MALFYILVTYVLIQFSWWAYMLIDLNREVLEQQSRIEALAPDVVQDDTQQELSRRVWMIVGEGTVFFIFLGLIFLRIRTTHKREEQLAAQQSNFLMSITHELKSPLASTKLYLQTMQKRDLTPDQQAEILGKTIKDTDRLHGLVENILLATRIDGAANTLHTERVNLSLLTAEQLDQYKTSIGQKHDTRLEIEADISAEVDRQAYTSVLLNLYENAIKYSPEGSEVAVELKKSDGEIVLKVADQGAGIAPEERAVIFDKFYRIGNEETRQSKGTGLGLYIVKSLVNLHDGTIRVTENTPHGSVFEVRLPSEN